MAIFVKRTCEASRPRDGHRVLVDRVRLYEISNTKAAVDLALGEIRPTADLQVWFNHDPARWWKIGPRYWAKLQEPRRGLTPLVARSQKRLADIVLFLARWASQLDRCVEVCLHGTILIVNDRNLLSSRLSFACTTSIMRQVFTGNDMV